MVLKLFQNNYKANTTTTRKKKARVSHRPEASGKYVSPWVGGIWLVSLTAPPPCQRRLLPAVLDLQLGKRWLLPVVLDLQLRGIIKIAMEAVPSYSHSSHCSPLNYDQANGRDAKKQSKRHHYGGMLGPHTMWNPAKGAITKRLKRFRSKHNNNK